MSETITPKPEPTQEKDTPRKYHYVDPQVNVVASSKEEADKIFIELTKKKTEDIKK